MPEPGVDCVGARIKLLDDLCCGAGGVEVTSLHVWALEQITRCAGPDTGEEKGFPSIADDLGSDGHCVRGGLGRLVIIFARLLAVRCDLFRSFAEVFVDLLDDAGSLTNAVSEGVAAAVHTTQADDTEAEQ